MLLGIATAMLGGGASGARAQVARAPDAQGTVIPASGRAVTYSVRTLDGAPFRIGPGEPATLVAVFATWCASCRTEFVSLDSLRRALAPRGVRVLALSVDEGDDERVRRYAAARRTQVTIAHDGTGAVGRTFGLVGVPESFLVDGTGAVKWHRQGELRSGMVGLAGAVRLLGIAPR